MATRLSAVTFDCQDPIALGQWWQSVLGWSTRPAADGEIALVDPTRDAWNPSLLFLACPDEKLSKNRIHLDLASDSAAHQATLVEDLLARGASKVEVGQVGVSWIVLADPEGNEFCVLEPRDRYRDCGRLASIVVDSADPRVAATFWEKATGWTIANHGDGFVSLHQPNDRCPDIDFVQNAEERLAKLRVHFDVEPIDGTTDVATEAARLIALGAREIDIGQCADPLTDWIVLVDPFGNEFCVVPSDG